MGILLLLKGLHMLLACLFMSSQEEHYAFFLHGQENQEHFLSIWWIGKPNRLDWVSPFPEMQSA